jgi:fructose-1,6-bisphosphatase/inositol monophosphatase family enzyme
MRGYLESKGTVDEIPWEAQDNMTTKSNDVDFCTNVDIENELLITQGLEQAFPDYDIIGEEAVGTGELPHLDPSTPTFIIDPIDGTTNFSQGLFLTCVSIGFCVGGSPVLGVVHVPATNEWYLAVSGYGAFRNGVPIRMPPPQQRKKVLSQAVVCCEFGYSRKQHEINAMLGAVSRILEHGCRGIRQLGSGVLDLCYVATGRIDVVYAGIVSEGWKPWDYAAGLVICQEAGCIMESICHTPGKDFDLYGKSVICGISRELVDDLRHVLLS